MEYAGRSMEYVPPSRVAKMAVPSPRARPGSTAVAVATARRSEYGSGGSILPVLTPTNSANASKRGSWVTTPRSSNDTGEDDLFQSAADSFAPPPRRAEVAAARRSEAARQRPTDALFASEAEQSQLAYMEQMYGTINLLNAELEHERRRNRAAPEAAADRLPASQPPKRDYNVYEEDTPITYGEFDDAPSRLVVAETPVAPSYSPRRLRAVPSSQPSTQHRVARPPVSPRTAPSSQDEELCATLGKNAELHIRSKDMERIVQKTELELELARKHIKMTERRAESREEKLRELLKEKLQWQKELKATRAQVVEEKMRQVDLFRDVEAAKRQFAADIEALEQDQRADQEENAHLRSQANEMRAQLNFQARKMEDMARQAQDEKERFVALVEDTRRRFREWKEGEAAALEAAREQAVRKLKTEYELKIERHLDEKQKLRDKVNDLEVSMQLLQKDRTLSPLELTLRKTTILGSKDNSGIVVAEQIETQSRILELENLLAHSQEYQARQAAIIKLSESTISRLMQEREVTALENLSLHPLGMESQRFRPDDNLYDADFTGSVAASSPVRRGTPPVTPSRNRQHGSELPVARSPRSRSQTPRRGDLEASILSATPSDNVPESAPSPVDRTANQSTINGDVAPTTRELELMKQLAQLRQELSETQAKSTKATCSNVDGVEARNNGEVASNIAAVIKEAVEAPTKDDVVIDEKNIAEAPQENSAVESEATSTNIDKLLLEEAKEPVGELSDVPEDPNVNEKWQTDSIISTDATETELHRVMESEPMSKMTTAAAVVSCSASSNLVPANEGHPNNQHNDNDGSQEDKRMDSSFLMGNDLVDAPAHNYEVCDEDGFCKLEGAHTLNYEDFSQPPQDEEEVGCPVDPELAGENLLEGTEADTEDLEETTLVVKSETILGNVNADGEADLSEMSKPPTIPLVEMSALEASSENADVSVGTGIEIESWDMTPISLEKTTTNHGTPIPNTDIEDNRGATIAQLENPSDDCKLDTRISANTADTVTGFAATESPDTASAAATEEAVNELKEEQQFPTTSAILSATLSQCDVAKFQATEDEVQLTPETSNLDSGVPLSSCTPDTTCVAESFVTIVGCAAIALVNSSSQGNAPSREGDIKKFIGRPESAPIDPPNHVNPTGTTRADCNEPGSDTKHEDDLIADEVSDATDTKRLAVDTVQQNNMDEQCGAMDAGGSDLAFAVKDYTETERFQAKELAKMFVEEVLENFPVTDYHAEIADGNKENSFDPSPPTEFEEASVNFGRGEARSLVSTAVFEADQVAIQDPPAPASLRAVESPLLIEAEKYAESKRVDYPDIDDMCGIVDGTIATDAETGTSGKSGCNADVEIEAHHDTKSSEENLNDLAPNVDTQAIAVDEIETKSLSLKSGSYTEEVNNQENEKFHFESQHRPNENCTPSEEFKVSNAIPIESVSSGAVSKTEVPISTDGCNSCTQDIATTVAKFFASQIIAEVVSSFPRHNENNNTEEDRLNRISDSGSDDAVDVESTSAALNEMLVSENTLPVNSAEAKQPLDAGKNDLTSDQPFCSTDKSVDINNENGSIPKTALLSTGTVNKEGTIVNESAKALIGAVIAHVITSKDSTPHENGTSAIDEEKAAINEIATELVDAVKELVDAVIAHVIANKELMPHVNITPAINSVVNMNGEGEDKAVEPLRKTNGIAVSTEMAEMALTSANDGTVEICDSSLQVPLTGVAEECNFKEPCRLPADNQDDVAGQNIDLLLNDVIDRVEQSYNAESLVPSIGVACNNSPLGAEDIAQTSSTNREVSTNNNRMPFPDSTSAVVIAPISLDANGEVMHALQVVDMPKIADIIVTEADDGAYHDVKECSTLHVTSSISVVAPVRELETDFTHDNSLPVLDSLIEVNSRSARRDFGSGADTMPVPETRDESIKVDPEASGDGEFPVAAESGFTVDEDESAVHLIAEGIVDNVAALEKIAPMDSEENTSEMLPEITANEHQENVVEAEADKSSPSPCAIDPAVDSVVAELCSSVVALQVTRTTHRCSADFTFDSKEETDTCPPELATANRLGQARPSVLLWQAPFETACAKEAVESSAKRRASKRRTSRRVFCDLLAFPTELARTSSDTTLLAYDAQHEQSQPFALLDHNILSINPNGRHIQLDDYDICDGKIIGKRKTLMQELHSKNIALRQIPRFNYLPVRIKFQWSDFVVATPVRPSTSNFEGALLSKSPVEPMRLLQKRGTKLSCGTYVIVSAFIRPLEDGNENLRVQIYDAERVEEFQFDFSEDVMKKYQLESTGLEAQSREFLGHLEFRRDEDTVIIKLPEKKVGEGAKPSSGERFQSERTMVGDGDPRRRLLPTNNYQKRPATSPEGMNTQGSKSLAVEALSQLATDEVESPSVQEQTTAEEFRPR